MATTGTATINFGTAPSNYATATVSGTSAAAITSASYVDAFMMADSTADHNIQEHIIVNLNITCGNIVNATSFDIYAYSPDLRLTGSFLVRWVYT